jgi:hypothetical protein
LTPIPLDPALASTAAGGGNESLWAATDQPGDAHAVVLSVDEKSQIQALDRTQPGLPMKRGRAGTMTHDKRHGTTTLFAALNILDGTVIGRNMQRHRHQGVHPLPQYHRGAGVASARLKILILILGMMSQIVDDAVDLAATQRHIFSG